MEEKNIFQMGEEEFKKYVKEELQELEEKKIHDNKKLRIHSIFQKYFKPALQKYIEIRQGKEELLYRRTDFIDEPCNYDIRTCMDDEYVQLIRSLGYNYVQMLSDSDRLVFQKIKELEDED